ncbi:hypothetical protein BaRGS_00027541 [Batillaria attramentaria]|uniref:tRNA (34-2'-O)-methyltransferase regulator WDR6 n=1 Tax=Batillaria attramentaria TaxID=370345 RepID=A0ABD0K1U6_9CAEN
MTGCVGPVTALCVWRKKILAGCGSQVQVFDAETGLFEKAFCGLQCTNVHGLQPGPCLLGDTAICVFGGKRVRILTMPSSTCKWSEFSTSFTQSGKDVDEFEDWIWDVAWLKQEEVWTLGLALAHNVVLHYNWQSGIILQRVTCREKCLLCRYCARFIGSTWSNLIVAAGTVFNQVVLWSVAQSADGVGDGGGNVEDHAQPVLHRLSGHQGVIFSICYHHTLQRICSVSDDRSIRMWQLQFTAPAAENETLTGSDWCRVTFTPMLTLYGHSARVWDVVLLSDRLVSVGEDACCVVWDYGGQVLQRCKGHKGRSIWSLAASEDESFVVTGGGDSSIRQWHLQTASAAPLTQLHLCVPEHIQVSPGDFARTLALWDYDTVLLMTNAGSLLCHILNTNTWQTVFNDPMFASYSTLAVSPSRAFLAVGSIAGYVRVIARGKGQTPVSAVQVTSQLNEGKVCGLTWVNDTHLVSTGLGGQCVLARVISDPDKGSITFLVVALLELPVCKHRWVVAGCLLPANSHLVCGDRNGSVHVYQLTKAVGSSISRPVQTFSKIHESAGVTSICYHGGTVFTAGRDGQYRRWGMKNGSLELLSSSRVFKGFDWIDRLVFTEQDLSIYGFYSARGERLLEVECGGGHRAWDCLKGGSGFRFLFLKARQVVMVTGQQRVGQVLLKPPLHGLKVCDMKHIITYGDRKGPAEKGGLQWNSRHSLQGHLSSVRTLAAVNCHPALPYQPEHSLSAAVSSNMQQAQKEQGKRSSHAHQHSYFLPECQPSGTVDFIPACTEKRTSEETAQKIVFSAGGRAQIQVWKLSIATKPSDVHGKSAEYEDCDKTLAETSTIHCEHAASMNCQTGTPLMQSGKDKNLPSTQENRLPSSDLSASIVQHEESIQTNFEHLGGCFLGESRHKRAIKPWKTRYLKLDPETRIMDLAAVAAGSLDPKLPVGMYLVAAAGSDGVLRLFLFEEDGRQFTLLCQSSHHSGCILQVHIHMVPTQTGVQPLLLSAATDGKIAIRDLRPITQWLLAFVGQHKSPRASVKTAPDTVTGLGGDAGTNTSGTPEVPVAWSQQNKATLLSDASIKHPGEVVVAAAGNAGADARHACGLRLEGSQQNKTAYLSGDSVQHPGEQLGEMLSSNRDNGSSLSDEARSPQVDSKYPLEESSRCPVKSTAESEALTVASVGDVQEGRTQCVSDEEDESSDEEQYSGTLSRTCLVKDVQNLSGESLNLMQELFGVRASHESQNPLVHRNVSPNDTCHQQARGIVEWPPDQEIKVHQSGVNSLHMKSFEGECQVVLASGGDDNALTVCQLTLLPSSSHKSDGQTVFRMNSIISKPDAHAAQTTGVWILSSHHILTASIDQRVIVWHLVQEMDGPQLIQESCRLVDIADVSSMDVWRERSCVYIGVCGEGIALLTLEDTERRH